MKVTHRSNVAFLSLVLFLCPLFASFLSKKVVPEVTGVLSFFDYFSVGFFWLAAGLIWARVKFAWLMALSLMTSSVFFNAYLVFVHWQTALGPLYLVQFFLGIAAMGFVIWMVHFLNHKFLDRRDQFSIWGPAHRYVVSEPAVLNSNNQPQITGTIKSLSFSGALLEVDKDFKTEAFSTQEWFVDIPRLSYTHQPVDVARFDERHLRLKFLNLNPVSVGKFHCRLKTEYKKKTS